MFQVFDTRTGAPVGKASASLNSAIRKRDRLDTEYGACRYFYRRVGD
jgi:hypothetical protein